MGKRKFHSKKSTSSLPKGLPQKRADDAMNVNPFENARASFAKKAKFEVHNRGINNTKALVGPSTALQRSLESRKKGLKVMLDKQKKAGSFVDRRIGEKGGGSMTEDQRMLARVVRERVRRSKKASKFSLDDDDGDAGITLTHKGKVIDENYDSKHDSYDDVILSDDDDDRYGGQLDKMDTEMHFGGAAFDRDRQKAANPYGPSDGSGAQSMSIGDAYRSRKNDLDEMIRRRKIEKAEKAKSKEEQVDTFEEMDDHFHELKDLLQFRDKEKERKEKYEAKLAGTISNEEKEMDDWNREVKEYHLERRVKATDRTRTPEEIAKEEAERLHELETRRIARMNGDFEDDDLSDISEDEGPRKKGNKKLKKNKKKRDSAHNPDELDSEDEIDEDELEVRFTPDGLVYVDKNGKVVKKAGEKENDDTSEESVASASDESSNDDSSGSDESNLASIGGTDDEASAGDADSDSDEESAQPSKKLVVGAKIMANYRADEQFDGKETWYPGTISNVQIDETGKCLYDIDYDDGDVEEGVKPKNIQLQEKSKDEKENDNRKKKDAAKLKKKRQKAKEKARKDIPYVFEVPTTLEALSEMIGNYASTGKDACLIIERIHASNSVRLDKRNIEKMQNFYDVLLRRFVGVGDALHASGDGGDELTRYDQLDSLTVTLYKMAQDSPSCAGAVWGRRLGVFQKALAKRLRDAEFVSTSDENEEKFTTWHSTGTLLLLRAMGHIFPVTDLRHVVVTPTIILLGQTIAQSPVRSLDDLCRGLFCCSLMIEYCKDAARLPSEAFAFLSGVVRLFSDDPEGAAKDNPLPSLQAAIKSKEIRNLRTNTVKYFEKKKGGQEKVMPKISLEKEALNSKAISAAIFGTTFCLIEACVQSYSGMSTESEIFEQLVLAMLCLNGQTSKLPKTITNLIAKTGELISAQTKFGKSRPPLCRRSGAKTADISLQSLAPRMEDPTRYSMSRDKNKTQIQAERDRIRREYRREHKAATRELRLDAAYIENTRRKEKEARDSREKTKRQKNYSWLEQEQATINQQVRQGGGLLKGGGTGVARVKAATGKLGIKRGGKL